MDTLPTLTLRLREVDPDFVPRYDPSTNRALNMDEGTWRDLIG